MLGKGIAVGKSKNLYNIIGKKYLNKKSFPYGNKINFNSIRKGEVIGEHEVLFSSGKEIIKLKQLELLVLSGTKISATGISEVLKVLPKCNIISKPVN